ncbi:MAG: class I SAM-dependent methyltransferase [Acidimicrobiales bacterium]|jgi:SAM-dependent methyltransferase
MFAKVVRDKGAGPPVVSGNKTMRRRNEFISSHLRDLPADALVLDVGCGTLRSFESACACRYLTTDLRPLENVDFSSDASSLPLADDSVDTVLSIEILEHVPHPHAVVAELARILKPGGTVILTVPSFVPRHDTHDFWRFTAQGLEQLCSESFPDGKVEVFGGTFEALGQLVSYYLSVVLHVLRIPSRTALQILPSLGYWLDRHNSWSSSADALHTIAYDLLFIGKGGPGPGAAVHDET